MKKQEIEKMIYDIFRICDSHVDIGLWDDFHKEIEKTLKKRKLDIWKIYYGMSEKQFRKSCLDDYIKWSKKTNTVIINGKVKARKGATQ